MSMGHSPQAAQHMPDRRKNADDVTEAEKEEAHRRIVGGDESDEGGPSNVPLGAQIM